MTTNQQLARALTVSRRHDGWWVAGLDSDIGPYRTKAEAQEARKGVQAFLRHEGERGFVTVGR